MRKLILAGLLAGLGFLSPLPARADDAPTAGQTAHVFDYKGEKPVALGYLLYVPEGYAKVKETKWPVILFLHGSGERGNGTSDINKVKQHGPPKIVDAKKDFGFIVISPQCPTGGWWDADALKGLLDDVLKTLPQADKDRVYLTGLSMGGFGSWDMAAKYPKTFAAVAPICGGVRGGKTDDVAAKIKDLPIWVFHGEDDPTVKIKMAEDMVAALKKAGAKDVQFTHYPKTGHDSWTVTYNNDKLYEWFLSHKRAG